jgi:Cdc6-like AAA superfamily ATPase
MEYQLHKFEVDFVDALEKGNPRIVVLSGNYGSGRTHWLKNNLEDFYKKILSKIYPDLVYEEIIFRPDNAQQILNTVIAEIEAIEDRILIYCIDEFSVTHLGEEIKITVSNFLTKANQLVYEHKKPVFLFLVVSKEDLAFVNKGLPDFDILH